MCSKWIGQQILTQSIASNRTDTAVFVRANPVKTTSYRHTQEDLERGKYVNAGAGAGPARRSLRCQAPRLIRATITRTRVVVHTGRRPLDGGGGVAHTPAAWLAGRSLRGRWTSWCEWLPGAWLLRFGSGAGGLPAPVCDRLSWAGRARGAATCRRSACAGVTALACERLLLCWRTGRWRGLGAAPDWCGKAVPDPPLLPDAAAAGLPCSRSFALRGKVDAEQQEGKPDRLQQCESFGEEQPGEEGAADGFA